MNWDSIMHKNRIAAQLSFFRVDVANERIQDPITLAISSAGSSTRQGIAGVVEWSPSERFELDARATWNHARLSGPYADAHDDHPHQIFGSGAVPEQPSATATESTPGKFRVPGVADFQVFARAAAHPLDAIKLWISGRSVGAHAPIGEPDVRTQPYAVADLGMTWSFGEGRALDFELQNLSDIRYVELALIRILSCRERLAAQECRCGWCVSRVEPSCEQASGAIDMSPCRQSAIRQCAPEPFERAKAEAPQPERRNDQLEYPHGNHNCNLAGAFDLSEEAQAMPVEDPGAENRLQNIVGEGRPPHGDDRDQDGAHNSAGGAGLRRSVVARPGAQAAEGNDKTDPAERNHNAAPVVVLTPDEERHHRIPVDGESCSEFPERRSEVLQAILTAQGCDMCARVARPVRIPALKRAIPRSMAPLCPPERPAQKC